MVLTSTIVGEDRGVHTFPKDISPKINWNLNLLTMMSYSSAHYPLCHGDFTKGILIISSHKAIKV